MPENNEMFEKSFFLFHNLLLRHARSSMYPILIPTTITITTTTTTTHYPSTNQRTRFGKPKPVHKRPRVCLRRVSILGLHLVTPQNGHTSLGRNVLPTITRQDYYRSDLAQHILDGRRVVTRLPRLQISCRCQQHNL